VNQLLNDAHKLKDKELAAKPDLVRTLLEEDQLVAFKKRNRFPRRKLSVGLKVLLWLLRIYVIVMLVIVIWQIVLALK
jgi:hypothetical protein